MVRSMTAFARQEQETALGVMSWELRAVNHRYLEMNIRLPEELRALEATVRELIGGRFGRGKVDCFFRFKPSAGIGMQLHLNDALLQELVNVLRQARELVDYEGEINMMELLRWPGAVQVTETNQAQVQVEAFKLLDAALDEMQASREREGKKLRDVVLQRCDGLDDLVGQARQCLPQILDQLRSKLHSRLSEIKEELDPQRVEQEIVLMAQKIDVAEELDRIDVHVDEVRRVLGQNEPVGRRLDFLMQEFNREANTLGSKSVDMETTRIAVDMKVLIEQMREQIQNIE